MKSHIAYTSAGNSQNGATSSRGTVILLQIKLHYSLLLIVIMTVLLCSILLFLMILCFFFYFYPVIKPLSLISHCLFSALCLHGTRDIIVFHFSAGSTDGERGKVLQKEGSPQCPVHMTKLLSRALHLHLTFSAHLRCVMCFKQEELNLQEDLTQQDH